MNTWKLTRRNFLSLTASFGFAMLVGCSTIPPPPPAPSTTAYRRSGKGRHVSNAAKKHNANHLYATEQAALQDPAHKGDRSRVVKVTISNDMYLKLFPGNKLSADLRHDL